MLLTEIQQSRRGLFTPDSEGLTKQAAGQERVVMNVCVCVCRSETMSFKSPARPIRLFFVRGQMRNEGCLVEINPEVHVHIHMYMYILICPVD